MSVADGVLLAAVLCCIDENPRPNILFGAPAIPLTLLERNLSIPSGTLSGDQVINVIRPLADSLFDVPRAPKAKVLKRGETLETWVIFESTSGDAPPVLVARQMPQRARTAGPSPATARPGILAPQDHEESGDSRQVADDEERQRADGGKAVAGDGESTRRPAVNIDLTEAARKRRNRGMTIDASNPPTPKVTDPPPLPDFQVSGIPRSGEGTMRVLPVQEWSSLARSNPSGSPRARGNAFLHEVRPVAPQPTRRASRSRPISPVRTRERRRSLDLNRADARLAALAGGNKSQANISQTLWQKDSSLSVPADRMMQLSASPPSPKEHKGRTALSPAKFPLPPSRQPSPNPATAPRAHSPLRMPSPSPRAPVTLTLDPGLPGGTLQPITDGRPGSKEKPKKTFLGGLFGSKKKDRSEQASEAEPEPVIYNTTGDALTEHLKPFGRKPLRSEATPVPIVDAETPQEHGSIDTLGMIFTDSESAPIRIDNTHRTGDGSAGVEKPDTSEMSKATSRQQETSEQRLTRKEQEGAARKAKTGGSPDSSTAQTEGASKIVSDNAGGPASSHEIRTNVGEGKRSRKLKAEGSGQNDRGVEREGKETKEERATRKKREQRLLREGETPEDRAKRKERERHKRKAQAGGNEDELGGLGQSERQREGARSKETKEERAERKKREKLEDTHPQSMRDESPEERQRRKAKGSERERRAKTSFRRKVSRSDDFVAKIFEGLPFGPDIPTFALRGWLEDRWKLLAAEMGVMIGVAYVIQASGL